MAAGNEDWHCLAADHPDRLALLGILGNSWATSHKIKLIAGFRRRAKPNGKWEYRLAIKGAPTFQTVKGACDYLKALTQRQVDELLASSCLAPQSPAKRRLSGTASPASPNKVPAAGRGLGMASAGHSIPHNQLSSAVVAAPQAPPAPRPPTIATLATGQQQQHNQNQMQQEVIVDLTGDTPDPCPPVYIDLLSSDSEGEQLPRMSSTKSAAVKQRARANGAATQVVCNNTGLRSSDGGSSDSGSSDGDSADQDSGDSSWEPAAGDEEGTTTGGSADDSENSLAAVQKKKKQQQPKPAARPRQRVAGAQPQRVGQVAANAATNAAAAAGAGAQPLNAAALPGGGQGGGMRGGRHGAGGGAAQRRGGVRNRPLSADEKLEAYGKKQQQQKRLLNASRNPVLNAKQRAQWTKRQI